MAYEGEIEMRSLLEKWDIPQEIKDNFINNKIQTKHLVFLSDEQLKEICPTLGIRIDIKRYIEAFKDSTTDTEPNSVASSSVLEKLEDVENIENLSILQVPFFDTSQLGSLSYNYLDTPRVPDFGLKTLLTTTPCGKSILNYYKTFGKLDNTRRNRLTDTICRHIYTYAVNHKIKYDEYNALAGKIVTLFPSENIGTYFVRPVAKGKSPTGKPIFAKGKLIDKVRNLLYKSEEHKRFKNPIYSEGETSNEKRQQFELSENEDYLWLLNNTEPWEVVMEKWTKTYDARQTNLDNVQQLLKLWPVLNDPRSVVLINLDFDHMYPNRNTFFFKNWITFFKKVRDNKKETLSDPTAKLLDEGLDLDDPASADNNLPITLMLLAHYVPPKGRNSKSWKFSTAECIEAIFIHVKNPGDIDVAIQKQRDKAFKRKQTVQPYVIIQGYHIHEFNAIYIIIDNLKYPFQSMYKAFDTLFKLYHTFHCKYPAPAEHLYLIVQRCIYNIATEHDKVIPFILDILDSNIQN